MKKMLLFAPAALLTALLFTACTKEKNRVFNANFYTSEPNTQMFLYIDDVYQGQLAFFQNKPECGGSAGDGPKLLGMQLNSGEYKVTGKNAQGTVLSTAVIRLRANSLGSTGNVGGIRMEDNGSCLTVDLTK